MTSSARVPRTERIVLRQGATMDMAQMTEDVRVMGEALKDLDATLLHGWPFDDLPTEQEAEQIEATFNELCLHDLGRTNAQRWYVAGNIVARFRRDASAS